MRAVLGRAASRGGASDLRVTTGTAPGSANRRVHFAPFHQRILAPSSGSGYQPAGATGGGRSAFFGNRSPVATARPAVAARAVENRWGVEARCGAGSVRPTVARPFAPRAGATLTRTGPTSVLARTCIRRAMCRLCAGHAARSSRIAISGGDATRTGGPHAPAPRLV